jgi:hypothetical protein
MTSPAGSQNTGAPFKPSTKDLHESSLSLYNPWQILSNIRSTVAVQGESSFAQELQESRLGCTPAMPF